MMLQNGNPNAEIKFHVRKKCSLDVRNGEHNLTSSNSTTPQQKKTIWLTLENCNVIQMPGKHRKPQRFAFLLQSFKIPQTHFSSILRNQIPIARKKNSSDSSTLILSAVSHQAPTGQIK